MEIKIKTIGTCLVVFLAVMLVLMSTTPVAMAAVTGQVRLEAIPGTYVDDSEDAWFIESFVTSVTSFNLDITNHNGGDIHHLYLLVAVDRDPEGIVTVSVNGDTVAPYDGIITKNNKALVTETNPDYKYPGHGIYIHGSSTCFEVVEVAIHGDDNNNGILEGDDETITVPVEITLDPTTSEVKVHFDAVGADINNEAIAFVPPSEDATYYVPEFTTIAIPVAAILGLLFFFNRRKRRKEMIK